MPKDQKILLAINLAGGSAVLLSYVLGFLFYPNTASLLWGLTPPGLLPYFYACMLLAAIGYLLMTWYLLFRLDPNTAVINIRAGFTGFRVLYLLVLIPSALWLPLTLAMLNAPSGILWFLIRLDLLLVGLGGLGFLSALLSIQPRGKPWLAAFIGAIFFCLQVVILDAFIWPSFFVLP